MKVFSPTFHPLMDRRYFLRGIGSTLGATAAFPAFAQTERGTPGRSGGEASNRHVLIFVCIAGGVDKTYMFDARSLSLTDRGKQQNYCYNNSDSSVARLEGAAASPLNLPSANTSAGIPHVPTLISPLAEPMLRHRNKFTLLNGVTMLTGGLEGHGQNMYHLLTGSAGVNGECFFPWIGAKSNAPLECIHIASSVGGAFEGDGNQYPTNFDKSVVFPYTFGANFGTFLRNAPAMDVANDPALAHVLTQMGYIRQGSGSFRQGLISLKESLELGPRLRSQLMTLDSAAAETGGSDYAWGNLVSHLRVGLPYLQNGITNVLSIMFDGDATLDVHGASSAQQQPLYYRDINRQLAEFFDALATIPFDNSGRKIIDVATVVVTSEFSRTMISESDSSSFDVGATGTDHNPLSNWFLLAGKGIRPGLTLGATDLTEVGVDGAFLNVSAAHRALNPNLRRIMGKPFDHSNYRIIDDLSMNFSEERWLTCASVINTIMSQFNVDERNYYKITSSSGSRINAPVLRRILT